MLPMRPQSRQTYRLTLGNAEYLGEEIGGNIKDFSVGEAKIKSDTAKHLLENTERKKKLTGEQIARLMSEAEKLFSVFAEKFGYNPVEERTVDVAVVKVGKKRIMIIYSEVGAVAMEVSENLPEIVVPLKLLRSIEPKEAVWGLSRTSEGEYIYFVQGSKIVFTHAYPNVHFIPTKELLDIVRGMLRDSKSKVRVVGDIIIAGNVSIVPVERIEANFEFMQKKYKERVIDILGDISKRNSLVRELAKVDQRILELEQDDVAYLVSPRTALVFRNDGKYLVADRYLVLEEDKGNTNFINALIPSLYLPAWFEVKKPIKNIEVRGGKLIISFEDGTKREENLNLVEEDNFGVEDYDFGNIEFSRIKDFVGLVVVPEIREDELGYHIVKKPYLVIPINKDYVAYIAPQEKNKE